MPAAAALKVLVVDDQLSMRALVRQALAALGVGTVREVASGEAALDDLRTNPAHLVLSDQNMPGMSGLELLGRLRRDPQLAKTPFIMLTGTADKDVVVQAVKLGVNNYLVKPFSPADLRAKIERCFGPLT